MTDITAPEPHRARRPARSRRPIPQRRRRRIRVERISVRPSEVVCTADDALSTLMENGEIFKVGRRYYLVAPVCEKVLERLIIAAGRTEDNEENGDLEPNTGDDEPDEDNEPTLGWSNPSVGVSPYNGVFVTGDQLSLAAGHDPFEREGDPCDLGEPEEYLD